MILLLLSILCLSILNCLFVVSLFCSQRVSDLLWKSCLRLEFWLQVVQTLYRVSGMGDSAVARLTCTIAWLRSFRRNTWLLLSYEGTLRVWQWAPPLSRRWGQSMGLKSIFRTSSLWKVFRDDKMEPAYARRGRDCITAIFAYDDAIANTGNIILWFIELRSRTIRSIMMTHHDAIRHHCHHDIK